MAEVVVDAGSFTPVEDGLRARDPLGFPGYGEALERARSKTGASDSVAAGPATIGGRAVEYAEFSFGFLGGSMGEVAGERLARAMERAAERGVPFVLRTTTGGARMQEGMRALVQMPKVVASRLALGDAGQPFIAVFADPTTGGVLASLGALADIVVAEGGATIGFAGPRVAASFLGRPLDGTSHRAETAFAAGLVDEVVEPGEVAAYLANVLATLADDEPLELAPPEARTEASFVDAWDAVEAARSDERPHGAELLVDILDAYVPLHGDRAGGTDPTVDVAIARVAGRRCMVLALDRRRSPGPSCYRKAQRAIAIADRLQIPLVSLVDTPGADPSEDSESQGIAWAIAELFAAMLSASVPTLAIVTGEGGSGGALAYAAADRVLAYEGSIFSVIAPELAAEILWRDADRGADAARMLKLTAAQLLDLGIADAVLSEPMTADSVRRAIAYHLADLTNDRIDPNGRVNERRQRWRNIDGWGEAGT
ncbi:MAG TPA: carboxyl transferase domain-containing protein [Actinomycetota bacterium]|nr:carboxyl transferase domain-containing protein [Actinomycetota bacterium]